ncbi:MAG: hypothetical protein M0P57_04040 [Syntrophales bacterium]|jgi:hypothetical protein|nr:hypothetical protein [Syntrophales bacterium]MDY0043212.1 hypothetical protein [Syntrophales bacterium]
MEPIHTFDPVTCDTPWDRIYRRLGYRKGITNLSSFEKRVIDDAIDSALMRIHLKGTARRLSISSRSSSEITLTSGTILQSEALSRYVNECGEIVLMGATAGSEIIAAIGEETTRNNLSRAVVFDAAASEIVDSALDWIGNFFGGLIRRENKLILRKHFSAGYGDFALKNQHVVFDLLRLDRLGIFINEKAILVPEKTVTAIAGIKELKNKEDLTYSH